MKNEEKKVYVGIDPKDGAIKKISEKKFSEKGLFTELLTRKESEELYYYYKLLDDCDIYYDELSNSGSRLTIEPLI